MPFKSEAQKRKIKQLEASGKVPEGTYKRFDQETGDEKLPERVKKRNSKSRTVKGRIWPV